jgi:UDP-N-acetylmuramoyl-tripeptide--D-alanyl-D-alanine ligase
MKQILSRFILWYLRTAAVIQLTKIKPKVIGLTGSAGKTSLRNAVYAILKDHFRVKKSVKANSETGIPLDILGLHATDYSFFDWCRLLLLVPVQLLTNWQKYDFYIAELGVDEPEEPKNMSYLLRFIHPKIAIFLNVASVHSEQFENAIPKGKTFINDQRKQEFIKGLIAKEKGRLIADPETLKTAVVNADDSLVMEQAKSSKVKIYTFGYKTSGTKPTELKIVRTEPSLKGTTFHFLYEQKPFSLLLPYLLPDLYGYTLGAAILTGLSLDLSLADIIQSLAKDFVLPPGRFTVLEGIKKTTIVDSSYNASKIPVMGLLDLAEKLKTDRQKILVLGDMRELGSLTKIEHEEVAHYLISRIDRLVLIGPQTKNYVLPIVKEKVETHWFNSSYGAANWLVNNLKGKEIVLVKGSQNTIFTEVVTEALLLDKKQVSKLCRRGPFWNKQRAKVLEGVKV